VSKKLIHFNGTQELARVQRMRRVEFEARSANPASFPADLGTWQDSVLVGFLPHKPLEATTFEHLRPLLVERTIKVITTEKPHVCDWRCMGAHKGTECRCECGGKNHGINGPQAVAA
jgi:hypothetical protein